MQKVEGISSVRVSLNEGLTVLELKPGNAITLARLRELIRNNGFPTRDALIVATGRGVASGSNLVFEVAGTGERYPVAVATAEQRKLADELRATPGPWLLTGTVDTRDSKSMMLAAGKLANP